MYHRIAEKDVDPWSLCVTPQHFAEHLEVLQKQTSPISLRQLVQAHQYGNIPDRAVIVTFDDGYANNLYNAKPLLERYNIPATIFVTTGYIEKNREFWWDELDQMLLKPGRLPDKLCLKINGSTHQWKLGAAVNYNEENYRRDHNHQSRKGRISSRISFYYSVWKQLQPLVEEQRRKTLNEIQTWADAKPAARQTHRSLVPEEVCALEQGGLVEVGVHTVTHPFLSTCSVKLQREEIQESKARLEEVLGHQVTSFAYPFGAYAKETIPLVRETGFDCACSTTEETVWHNSDRFQLPRFEIRNWNGEEFEQRLLRWFQG